MLPFSYSMAQRIFKLSISLTIAFKQGGKEKEAKDD
jgi:hypothetical protein